MDTEQLKMILETLRTMGAAGQDAFVWWLLLDKALPIAAWLVTFAGLLWLALHLIQRIGVGGVGEQVRDLLGVGSPGPMTGGEARETMRRVREMVEKCGG